MASGETVDSLMALGRIPPLIVVGIDNGGRRRSAPNLQVTRRWCPYCFAAAGAGPSALISYAMRQTPSAPFFQ
jgi:hypothetical protein